MVWVIYSIIFLLGPEGLKIITDATSVWSILVLDITAKVVYTFFAASNIEKALREDRTHAEPLR